MNKMQQLEHLCGIDVGSTNIKMAVVLNGRIFERIIPSGDDFTQDALIHEVSEYCRSFNTKLRGLGIAFTGLTEDGFCVCHSPLSCLNGLNVESFKSISSNLSLINDANAATLAGSLEYPDSKLLVGVTNGTGIGAGILVNGKLLTGKSGFAGEIYGNPIIDSALHSIKVGKLCSGSKIYNKLHNTDTRSAETIIYEAAQYMGSVLVSLIHALNPDILYLAGGGFALPGYIDLLYQYISEHAYPHFLDDLLITQSRFGNIAGCIGAMLSVACN